MTRVSLFSASYLFYPHKSRVRQIVECSLFPISLLSCLPGAVDAMYVYYFLALALRSYCSRSLGTVSFLKNASFRLRQACEANVR
jgi:hypothetical protein